MNAVGGGAPGDGDRRRMLGIVASLALLLIAAALAVFGSGGDSPGAGEEADPRIASAEELSDLESDLGHAVYWAGERRPAQIELKREAGGNVFVRYLPPGVEAGDEGNAYLTVGTYPVTDAAAATRRFARGAGARIEAGPDGAVVVPNPAAPGSVYLAHPDSDLQVEVYDPRPGRALELIRAGAIRAAGEG